MIKLSKILIFNNNKFNMSIVNTLSAIFIVLIILLIVYTYSGSNKISSEEAKKMIKKGNIKYVIDVR